MVDAVATEAEVIDTTDSATDWYKDAIMYEVSLRSFFDSSNDGNGDFLRAAGGGSIISNPSASTVSGSCRSTVRRCATAATTSPISARFTQITAHWKISRHSSMRRIGAA